MVPARNEQDALPALVAALEGVRRPAGWPAGALEVLVLLNNCTDGSERVARDLAARRPWLRVAHVDLPPGQAHVGRARQLLFDTAVARLAETGRGGLVLSTDADSRPCADWLTETVREVEAGADAVFGRIGLVPEERAALEPGVRRLYLLDLGYRRALERVRDLYDPSAWDPYPRHHQHYGASLAVTAASYLEAGGMPLVSTSEDVALYRALEAAGARCRHSDRVRVETSARSVGRAEGGLADAFSWWADRVARGRAVTVEAADAADARLRALGRWRRTHGGPAPDELAVTPNGGSQEITEAIAGLRAHAFRLSRLSLAERLDAYRPPSLGDGSDLEAASPLALGDAAGANHAGRPDPEGAAPAPSADLEVGSSRLAA